MSITPATSSESPVRTRSLILPVAIALGANLGDREGALTAAAEAIDRLASTRVLACSHLYESEPWGDRDQPAFLNAVLLAETALAPRDLLEATQVIERDLGKRVVRRWGPRAIDIDILLFGDEVLAGDHEPAIPHPHIRARPFVYLPLAELAPAGWSRFTTGAPEGAALERETARLAPRGIWPSRPGVALACQFETASEEETAALAERLGEAALPGDCFALEGPVGAGKSVFIRALGRALGVGGHMPSPTFALCREYDTARGTLRHWDFYRMAGAGDLESAGFPADSPGIDAIEWATMFPDAIPLNPAIIRIEPRSDETRRISIALPAGNLRLRSAISRS